MYFLILSVLILFLIFLLGLYYYFQYINSEFIIIILLSIEGYLIYIHTHLGHLWLLYKDNCALIVLYSNARSISLILMFAIVCNMFIWIYGLKLFSLLNINLLLFFYCDSFIIIRIVSIIIIFLCCLRARRRFLQDSRLLAVIFESRGLFFYYFYFCLMSKDVYYNLKTIVYACDQLVYQKQSSLVHNSIVY